MTRAHRARQFPVCVTALADMEMPAKIAARRAFLANGMIVITLIPLLIAQTTVTATALGAKYLHCCSAHQ